MVEETVVQDVNSAENGTEDFTEACRFVQLKRLN